MRKIRILVIFILFISFFTSGCSAADPAASQNNGNDNPNGTEHINAYGNNAARLVIYT